MKSIAVFAAAGLLALCAHAAAQSGAEVVKAKGCLNCHDVDKPKIGPSFRDVAAKYRNSKEAPAALAAKLEEGKGHMKVDASAAELAAAIQLVLSAK